MVFWHVAGALFLFRWIFRDPRVDVRFLVAGALLPDLIDLPIGTWLAADRYSSGQLWGHTLLAPTLLVIVVLAATRRGARRRAWMALAIGMFFHLLLDGMWISREVFLWPLFGTDFPTGPVPYWADLWERAFSDPWRWIKEAIGIAYLVVLWHTTSLNDRDRRLQLVRTGVLTNRSDGTPA